MDWVTIDRLIEASADPTGDPWLDSLPARFDEEYHCYYRFLYRLIEYLRPQSVLEIGVYFGVASAFMASRVASYGGTTVGVDIESKGLPRDELSSRFNYHYILGDATDPNVQMKIGDYSPFGVVFQDSSHHYYESMTEWNLYRPMCNGIWICDDITPSFHDPKVDPPGLGMVQYFESLPGDKRLYPDILHRGNTMGVILCT